jgi:2-oxo-4-hydroxy-4-carboxy--5-ureidoimidazoline (OHCU) decarboxylase
VKRQPDVAARLRELGVPDVVARRLAAAGPHADAAAAAAAADEVVAQLSDDELRAALEELPQPPVQHADEGTLEAARLALDMYRQRYGYPFVSGVDTPTAEELLMRVRIRLGNEPGPEWRAAREHLRRLVRARLPRLSPESAS